MNEARWQRITDIVNDALNLPEPEQLAYAQAQCPDDALLFKEVSQWLQSAADSVEFLALPVAVDALTLAPLAEDMAERIDAARALIESPKRSRAAAWGTCSRRCATMTVIKNWSQ